MKHSIPIALITVVILGAVVVGITKFGWLSVNDNLAEGFFGEVPQTVADKVNEIHSDQSTNIQADGKYKQCPPTQIGSSTITCNEYVGPNGVGYQIKEIIETETSTIIKIRDYGNEPYRNRDIILPKTSNPETTTTQAL